MANSRARAGKIQGNPGATCITRKQVQKKGRGAYQKDTRDNSKDVPMSKAETI